MQTQAAVLHAVSKPLVVEGVELGPLRPHDVLVRIQASGLCHADLEVMRGSLQLPLPIVLGHEGAGVVEAVGSAVTSVRPDDHVVCSWSPNCGHCYYCDLDQPILCEALVAGMRGGHLPDGESRLSVSGRRLHHFSAVSSHAEHCIVPEAGAVPDARTRYRTDRAARRRLDGATYPHVYVNLTMTRVLDLHTALGETAGLAPAPPRSAPAGRGGPLRSARGADHDSALGGSPRA